MQLSAIEGELQALTAAGRRQLAAVLGPETSRGHFVRKPEWPEAVHAAQVHNAIRLQEGLPPEHLDFREMPPAEIEAVCAKLRAVGFEVRSYAQTMPPEVGSAFTNRTAIMNEYGGTKQQGIWRFTGERTVNVYSRIGGPYPDDPPSFSKPFVYRGEGLKGDQSFRAPGNQYLAESLATASPVRFWHGPKGGPITFLMWCVVVGHNWVRGVDSEGRDRREFAWQLQYVPDRQQSKWPAEVDNFRALSSADDDDEDVPEARPNPTYDELLARVASQPEIQPKRGLGRLTYGRREAARRAVLIRAGFKCEGGERCGGMAKEGNRKGEPILDVDHIVALSDGGPDSPENMAALCPNCHAAKTRGAHPGAWEKSLLRIAREHHEKALEREMVSPPSALWPRRS